MNEERETRCQSEVRQKGQEQERDERGGREQQGVHGFVAGGNGCANSCIDDTKCRGSQENQGPRTAGSEPIDTMAIVSAAASPVKLKVRIAT